MLSYLNSNDFSALHAVHLEIWKNFLWNWWIDYFIIRFINWPDFSSCLLIMNSFSILWSLFVLSRKPCFLWSPCLLLISESISLDTLDKTTSGITSICSTIWEEVDYNSLHWQQDQNVYFLMRCFPTTVLLLPSNSASRISSSKQFFYSFSSDFFLANMITLYLSWFLNLLLAFILFQSF